jgi:hypothetical protein
MLIVAPRAILGLIVFGAAVISVAEDEALDPKGDIDWIGSYLAVGGLILFNFVWKKAHPFQFVCR